MKRPAFSVYQFAGSLAVGVEISSPHCCYTCEGNICWSIWKGWALCRHRGSFCLFFLVIRPAASCFPLIQAAVNAVIPTTAHSVLQEASTALLVNRSDGGLALYVYALKSKRAYSSSSFCGRIIHSTNVVLLIVSQNQHKTR